MILEILKGCVILITARNVSANFLELLDLIGDGLVPVWGLDVLSDTLVELSLIHLCACISDYLDAVREEAKGIQAEESRERLRAG